MHGESSPMRGAAPAARIEEMMRSTTGAQNAAGSLRRCKRAVHKPERLPAFAGNRPRHAVAAGAERALLAEIHENVLQAVRAQEIGDEVGDIALGKAIERDALTRAEFDPVGCKRNALPVDCQPRRSYARLRRNTGLRRRRKPVDMRLP